MTHTDVPDHGTLAIPEGEHHVPVSPHPVIDAAIAAVSAQATSWVQRDVRSRIALLEELRRDTLAVAEEWTTAAAAAKGIPRGSGAMGEDWLSGPVLVLRNLRMLADTLRDVDATGRPQPPDVHVRPDGQVAVQVMPTSMMDQLLFPRFTAEVRLDPSVGLEDALDRMGRIYRPGGKDGGGVRLVLGAGNVSSIGPMDVLYALFADDRVVVLKMNPVNEHLGPFIERAFDALVREDLLRVVYGGAAEGAYLTDHDGIDEIHLTGSDKTFEAIVFGRGEEGQRRLAAGEPRIDKPVTAELGNVSPVIVVPGPWSDRDLDYQGRNIASMLVNNAGFNCIAARAIVQHRSWAKRPALLDAIRRSLADAAPREPYYPGARDRWEAYVDAHPEAERFGPAGGDRVPWTLIPDLDPADDHDLAFRTEAFCGVFSEVGIDAPRSIPDYLEQAVRFCNDELWGTLSASIIVHPRSLKDPAVAAAVERAIDELRYGSVVVNHWSAVAYGMVATPWGAAPGHELTDIQSGIGVVHNSFLLEDVHKTVVRGPFRTPLTPPWFHDNRTVEAQVRRVARLEGADELTVLPTMTWAALRG